MAKTTAKTAKTTAKAAKPAKAAAKNSPLTFEKDRRAAFIRLANGRTANALKAIQLIGNLSNTNDYDFQEADVAKIIDAIESELATTKSRFKVSSQKAQRQPVNLTI